MPVKRTIIIVFVLIFAAGATEGILEYRRQYIYQTERQKLGAIHNAIAFPAGELAGLAGAPADARTPLFEKIHAALLSTRLSHPALGYASLVRHYPATGRTICLAASGPPSETARIPNPGDSLDGTRDAQAAAALIKSGRQAITFPLFRHWDGKYWSSGYARCDGKDGPLPPGTPHLDIFRYDADASTYWFPDMAENIIVHIFTVWLLAGLPFAAYLLGKRHRLRTLQIHQLAQAVEHTETPIFVAHTINGRMKYANPSLCKQCGYSLEELRGKPWRFLRAVDPPPEIVAHRSAMFMQGVTIVAEWDLLRKDGATIPVSCTVTPVRDKTGHVMEAIGTLTDITGIKLQADMLQREKERAEQADAMQTLLIAATSNEVKAPLAELDRLSQQLAGAPLTREQADCAANIRKSCGTLRKLTRDISDLSRVEDAGTRLVPETIDPRTIIAETLDIVRPQAAERGITLRHTVAPDVPLSIVIAADRLRQILLNLVGNALKFTSSGEVEVRLKNLLPGTAAGAPPVVAALIAAEKKQGRVSLLFSIRDTGIGISAEHQKNLFQPFWQADNGSARRYEGAGLGLPISRQLARLLGGEICVESEPGRGSTFYCSVTCTLPPHKLQPPPA